MLKQPASLKSIASAYYTTLLDGSQGIAPIYFFRDDCMFLNVGDHSEECVVHHSMEDLFYRLMQKQSRECIILLVEDYPLPEKYLSMENYVYYDFTFDFCNCKYSIILERCIDLKILFVVAFQDKLFKKISNQCSFIFA